MSGLEREVERLQAEAAATNALLRELAAPPPHEDARRTVARALRRITGATLVVFSDYDSEHRNLRLRCIDMEPGLLEKGVALLGRRVEGLELPVSEEAYREMIGHTVGRRQTMTEASFGKIPAPVGAVIQKLLGVDRFVGLAHVVDGRLFGTSVLALGVGQREPTEGWLTSIAHTVALALRRRLTEEALRDSEARLRGILENLQDAYCQVDLSGRFTMVSPSALRMYRFDSAEEMIGLPAEALYADPLEWASVLEELRRSGRVNDWTGLGKRKDGTTFWVSMNARYFRDMTGQIVGTEEVVRDISERRRAEEERLKEAWSGTRKIKGIARGLGAFSRVEPDRREPVQLCRAIESAVSIAFNEIKYRARLDRELGETAPVLGSEGRLSQVFLNLLVNAAHAIHEGEVEKNRILIRTWQEGETVLAEVRDSGVGIAPELLEKIFEPFYTTKPVGAGSGLGLSIVRNILAGYGGTIEVASQPGEGSRFLIRLPAVPSASADDEVGAAPAPSPAARGRLLIIDDDDGIRSALRRVLSSHELVDVSSGERACEVIARDQRFDVIVCDMMMPSMSGMDVHQWLIDHHPELARRLVFMTGGAFTPDAQAYLERTETPQIRKPFDARELRAMIADRVVAARSVES